MVAVVAEVATAAAAAAEIAGSQVQTLKTKGRQVGVSLVQIPF